MSVAAFVLCKNEADTIAPLLYHLAASVDEIEVADNGSDDGTRELLAELADELGVLVLDDPEVAYLQSAKTTAAARRALDRGHSWFVPNDADEIWHCGDPSRRLGDFLLGVPPDVQIVTAQLFNHLPTALDPPEHEQPSPFERIGWRQREHAPLPKVACRLRPDLTILQGNHGATTTGSALTVPGLAVRHFSWRSADQYVRKIRQGSRAYAISGLPPTEGEHWRMFDEHDDGTIASHFRQWFWAGYPQEDSSLIYDPAPLRASSESRR